MLTNPNTPFTEEGFAALVADFRRLFLLVGGGSNDLNQATKDVTQDAVDTGENSTNATRLRNVLISTTAPIDGQSLAFSQALGGYTPTTVVTTGSVAAGGGLLAANNLSDVLSTSTARSNIGLGIGNSPSFNGLSLTVNLVVGSGTQMVGGIQFPVLVKDVSDHTASSGNMFVVMVLSGGASRELTLPAAASHGGRMFVVGCSTSANPLNVSRTGTDTVRAVTGVTMTNQQTHGFLSDGVSNWYELF